MPTRTVFLPASNPGVAVWSVLCRAALRGIDWAAEACGAKDVADRLERAELLTQGGAPPFIVHSGAVDWAKLGDVQRALVAREIGRHRAGV